MIQTTPNDDETQSTLFMVMEKEETDLRELLKLGQNIQISVVFPSPFIRLVNL